MHTVELLLDDELDGAVRAVWDRLAAAGLTSLALHPHPTNRPHVTLAAGAVPPAGLVLPLPLPMPVTLDGTIRFDGRIGMLAWRVVPSPDLLAVQAGVWRAMDDDNPLRRPENWVPHVSLARKVPPGFAVDVGVRRGRFVAARSYDTETRTVVGLR